MLTKIISRIKLLAGYSSNKSKNTNSQQIRILDNESDFIESGESFFLNLINDKIEIIFDVGTKDYSCFINLDKEVHFFEPIEKHIFNLSNKAKKKNNFRFNCFALGNENCKKEYFIKSESFCNRKRFKSNESINQILMKKGIDYMITNKITKIDFLKIDVEGYEFEVIKGFENMINSIGIIQFEYGGTYKDMNLKLIDVIDYLQKHNFSNFSYLSKDGLKKLNDFTDHYQYSNIVCCNKNSKLIDVFEKFKVN